MEIFKYSNIVLPSFFLFVVFVILYVRLVLRQKRIFYMVFDSKIISEIVPQKIYDIRKIKEILIISCLFFMIIALLGPQWGIEYQEKPVYAANIAFVVDTSLSMSARDIKPSRLDSIKFVMKSLVEKIKGYRITIIAFQDKAYVQCPLTDDIDAVLYFADILSPNMLPYPGTNIADAIDTTYQYLSSYSGDNIAILFTDGEDHSKKVDEVISKIERGKIKFITVGIGSPEGDLIYDSERQEYKKHPRTGKTVISRLDENLLVDIANKTEGKYIRYTSPENVSSEIESFISKYNALKGTKQTRVYKNRYQYFLLIAFLIIFVEFIIMEIPKSVYVALLLFLVPLNSFSLDISLEIKGSKANKFYNKKDYQEAYKRYSDILKEKPNSNEVKFNMANTLYKLNRFDDALKFYDSIDNKKLEADKLYNKGNTYYMKNEYEKAVDMYRKAIMKNPKNEDAKYNLELALKKIKKQSSSCSSSSKSSSNSNSNDNNKDNDKSDKNKDNKSSDKQKQMEQFLEMIKNIERENIKKASQQTQKGSKGSISNEFDW